MRPGRESSSPPPDGRAVRIRSVDVLRGLVVVLMAIDHVRVYSGLPAGGPTPGIFFTRWITHFVAPVFVFLAGTSAYLHGLKLADRGTLAGFLVTRGLWLIVLELTVIRVAWTFNFDFGNYLLAGVIWVIGWSMIVLAGLVFLPVKAVGAFGVVIIAAHNVMDFAVRPQMDAIHASPFNWLWSLGYFAFEVPFDSPLVVLYALVPWVGVMAAGYAFGQVFTLDADTRRRLCLWIGAGAVVLFVLLRLADVYGDPRHWQASRARMETLIAFLNTTKYPASLQFLLMTLGPAIFVLPYLERSANFGTRVLEVFGRVPMFYYLLHIPLIHLLALGVSLAHTGAVSPWLFENHPMGNSPLPPDQWWRMRELYLIAALAIFLLYFPCRWFGRLKARRRDRWLSYV